MRRKRSQVILTAWTGMPSRENERFRFRRLGFMGKVSFLWSPDFHGAAGSGQGRGAGLALCEHHNIKKIQKHDIFIKKTADIPLKNRLRFVYNQGRIKVRINGAICLLWISRR